jgi:hypothetical protein
MFPRRRGVTARRDMKYGNGFMGLYASSTRLGIKRRGQVRGQCRSVDWLRGLVPHIYI